MENKKNPKLNLEKKRTIFFQFGMIIALIIVLYSFDFKTDLNSVDEMKIENIDEIEEAPPISIMQIKKPQAPIPKIKKIELEKIILVDDEIEDSNLEIIDSEANLDEEITFNSIDEMDEEIDDSTPFIVVEEMPIYNPKRNLTYQEGLEDLHASLNRVVKYPAIAQESNIQGKVFLKFVVTRTGDIQNISVLRGVDPVLNNEAIRALKKMGKFQPGMQRGKPVNVWFTCFINFILQ
ncbi:MAG: TonB family protein [Marinifilaceae bacterium]|jgi:protein TonB|nr:TonB family protein [Marinifilaceae bacterium]